MTTTEIKSTNKSRLIDQIRESLFTESSLSFLDQLDETSVSVLHTEIEGHRLRVNEAQKPLFKVMAMATKLIPNFLVVRLSKDLNPYVMAQVSQQLTPKEAASLGESYDMPILAKIAVHIEPEFTAEIAQKMSFDRVSKIMFEMISAGFFHKLGEVSDSLPLSLLRKIVGRISDMAHVAQIILCMNDITKVQEAIIELSEAKRSQLSAELQAASAPSSYLEIFG